MIRSYILQGLEDIYVFYSDKPKGSRCNCRYGTVPFGSEQINKHSFVFIMLAGLLI